MSSTNLWPHPPLPCRERGRWTARAFLFLACFFINSSTALTAAEIGSPPPAPEQKASTNSDEALRSYLRLQEQIHSTQLAIERNRQEAEAAATRNAEALAGRLQTIEQSLTAQRARELEVMQSSNRVMLIVAGTFAALGFCAVLVMAYFQWRAVHRLAEISTALPAVRALSAGPSVAALGSGNPPFLPGGPAEQSNLRLLGALERLEQRIHDLEHTAPPALEEASSTKTGSQAPGSNPGNGSPVAPSSASASSNASELSVLLGKGQALLNLDQAEQALACFEAALQLDPGHAETLVRQGMALEKLGQLEEAEKCYDRAIAADGSATIAYLHKGGLYNRMERFGEALQCYERALQSREAPKV